MVLLLGAGQRSTKQVRSHSSTLTVIHTHLLVVMNTKLVYGMILVG